MSKGFMPLSTFYKYYSQNLQNFQTFKLRNFGFLLLLNFPLTLES